MRRAIVSCAALVVALGCGKGDKKDGQGAAATSTATTKTPSPTQTPPAPKKPQLTREVVEKEALALLAAWTKAQNDGDQAAYFGMYEPKHFNGVKRTSKGKVSRFDFAGWKTDRTRMFASKPTVASEDPGVTTWLDTGSKLKPGVSIVRFTQRWKTAKYADHGIKVLHLWRDPSGKHHIIYEDLLNAEPGWDDAPDEDVADLEIAPPKTDEEAMAIWRKLAPTGADYAEKLASIPSDPAVTRPLARVLLDGGAFACDKKIEYDECGNEYSEWEPLDPGSTFDDACLRRRLAVWAIEDAGLTEEDAVEYTERLVDLVLLPRPEDELPQAVMTLVSDMKDPIRVRMIGAAANGERVDLAEASLAGLSDASLIALYRRHHLDAAVKELAADIDAHRALLLEAMADDALEVATRSDLVDAFDTRDGADIKGALARVAEDDDCALAMSAAVELAERGDSSYLPVKPDNTDAQAHARALCMLLHDPNGARAEAVWESFLPPVGGPTVTEDVDDPYAEAAERYEPDAGAGAAATPDAAPEEPERLTRATSSLSGSLDASFGETEPTCAGTTCQVDQPYGHFSVSFEVAEDGTMYISNVHTYRWVGCGC
jgi:hypothetical protein